MLGVMRVVLPREHVWDEALWNHVSKFPDFAIPPHTIGDLGRVHGNGHFGTDSLDRLSEHRPSQWSPSERRPSLDRMEPSEEGPV